MLNDLAGNVKVAADERPADVRPAGDPLRTLLADNSIAPDERIALALAGPAFQWR